MASLSGELPAGETVQSHATSVVAWDIPSAIVAGERFRITVGVKCSRECRLANARFGVQDHTGAQIAVGTLAGDPWPGTTGLYVAEVELQAPAAEGLYTWTASSLEQQTAVPHAPGFASFGVRVVSRPEHVVTVAAFDAVTRAPLKGAGIVMHPYSATTDARGIAEVRVAKGIYMLFVTQAGYVTYGQRLDITEDRTTTAELSLDVLPERN